MSPLTQATSTTEEHRDSRLRPLKARRARSRFIGCLTSAHATRQELDPLLLPVESPFDPRVFEGLEKAERAFPNLPNSDDDDL